MSLRFKPAINPPDKASTNKRLLVDALSGGLIAGLNLKDTLDAFQTGLANGAQIALSYVMLGAFDMAIA